MSKKGPKSKYKPEEIIGKTINGIKVVSHDHDQITSSNKHPTWSITTHYVKCICPICGKVFITNYEFIKYGSIKSCGCIRNEKLRKLGYMNKTHGKRYTRLYRVWMGMKMRCYNTNNKSYPDYGGRGIYICDEWLETGPGNPGFMNFYNWAYANGYYDQPSEISQKDILTIDRIDVNGPYAPWNCRWITRYKQGSNKTNNVYITDVTGENITISSFNRKYKKKDDHYVLKRRNRGWSDAAIIYAATHPEKGIHKPHNSNYVDNNGFEVLIPSLSRQIEMYKNSFDTK